MNEPTGHTIDGMPWEEARGPHLPDRLTRVPILVWPFVILAVVQIVAIVLEDWMAMTADPGGVALNYGARIAASLLGAALFLRHPDAVRTLPILVLGVTLMAVEQVIGVLSVALGPLFAESWIVPTDDTTTYVGASVFSIVRSAIGMLAVLSLALGLAAARRIEGGVDRPVLVVLIGGSIVVAVASDIGFRLLTSESVIVSPIAYVASVVVGLASLLATSYLVAVALAGWLAGERPSIGWALAAASGSVTIAIVAAFALVSLIQPRDLGPLLTVFSIAIAASPVLLLVAFAIGLPSTEPDATPDPPGATTPGSAGS
jgi:hypothetical protein